MAEFLGLKPFEFQAADQLQRSWDAGASNLFEKPQDYPAMDDAARRILTDFFEPHNQQLYRLIDQDFGWTRNATEQVSNKSNEQKKRSRAGNR